MRERRTAAVRAIRGVLGAIDNAEAADPATAPQSEDGTIAGGVRGLGAAEVDRRELRPDDVAGIVRHEIEERRRWADEYEAAGQTERAAQLRDEAEVLTAFL
jgi:hypothetical protein